MTVRLGVAGAAPEDIAALRRLIDSSAQLRGTRLVGEPGARGQMGGILDVLAVTLGPEGTGIALAGALVAWLRARSKEIAVTIEGPGGKVSVRSRNIENPDEIVARIAKSVRLEGSEGAH